MLKSKHGEMINLRVCQSNTSKFLVLMAACLILLSGCSGGSYKISVGEIRQSNNRIWGTYRRFTGHYYTTLNLHRNDVVHVNYRFKSEDKGTISARIVEPDGATLKTIDSPRDEITIKKNGTHKLIVEGDRHRGGFVLNWVLNKAGK